MKKTIWQTIMPHAVAVGIFLVLTVIFCKPALESGVVMKQYDVANWQGMSHQSFEYKEKHGHFPLWATSMYSGMPAYQIALEGPWNVLALFDQIFQLALPKPFNFFWLACIGFYFLCQCLRIRPWVSIIASVAFAWCSFNPMIINAGHDTQMLALGYAPAVLGSVILLFDKKYISGFVLTALLTGLQVGQGHQQISYYLFLVIGLLVVFKLVYAYRAKTIASLGKGVGLAVVAGLLGVTINAVVLLSVYDYAKQSKRGGQLVLDKKQTNENIGKDGKTKGLTKEYAFQWSNGKLELMTILIPGIQGYGAHYGERDGESYFYPKLDAKSNTAQYLVEKLNYPEDQAEQQVQGMSRSLYWGNLYFTDAPIYMGALIFGLFVFAMVYVKNQYKWWILITSFLGLLMSLGSTFPALNYFLFDYLPLYNKFRAPTMCTVIPQLLMPLGVAMGIDKLITNNGDAEAWQKFRLSSVIVGGVFAVAAILYFTMDYSRENKRRTTAFTQAFNPSNPNLRATMDSINRLYTPEKDNRFLENLTFETNGNLPVARGLLTALREDRQAAYGQSLLRSAFFTLVGLAFLLLFIKKKVNANIMVAGLALFTAIDLMSFGSNFLNSYSFGPKDSYEASEWPLTPADQTILQDKDPNFRVYNASIGDPFAGDHITPYYHKSIGGHHPARLGIYDDLMEYQLSGSPNPNVINMLNAKWVIQPTQQGNQTVALQNPGALGNVWFVKNVKYVKGPAEEMMALNNFNPAETAIVDEAFKKQIPNTFTPADSSETIKQVAFDNDAIKYESDTKAPHLAVFSEVYYKDWNAYIDGKPAEYGKANYVLRTMLIPAGKHTIEFKFEPQSYYTGRTLTAVSGYILLFLILGYIGWLLMPVIKKNKAVA